MSKDEFLKHPCSAVTTLTDYQTFFKQVEHRGMRTCFLVRGQMELVGNAITGFRNDGSGYYVEDANILDAIAISLNEDQFDRAVHLLQVVNKRCTSVREFAEFMSHFFRRLAPTTNAASLKRFLTLHGGKLKEKLPAVFDTFCKEFVCHLKLRVTHLNSEKLLVDFVGQPYILTPAIFAKGFLDLATESDRINFAVYGWKEAIEYVLKDKQGGGKHLWDAMVRRFPRQFSGAYPRSDYFLQCVLANFKTKQQLEEAWGDKNAPGYRVKLFAQLNLILASFPSVLVQIVYDYSPIPSWIDLE